MTTEIGSGEAVRINPVFNNREAYAVLVQGEVKRPGSFEVIRGERLSSLLARAGGLTQEAYPAGAIFTRESARRQQAEAFTSAARNLDHELAMVLMKPDPPPAAQIAQARELSDELRQAQPVGRITVEADPAMLAIHPELDVVLEAGDRIFFPKRSLTVTVAGEVLAPASLQFRSEKTGDQYLTEAGGMTQYANSSRVFVLRPRRQRPASARVVLESHPHHDCSRIDDHCSPRSRAVRVLQVRSKTSAAVRPMWPISAAAHHGA